MTEFAYYLVGPTAVGKSAISHRIARDEGLCIVSADSMQVYRGMDIGTAKATMAERSEVPYYCVDLVDPWETFSVGHYCGAAATAGETIEDEGSSAIVVGGTGLYVKALTEGLSCLPRSDKDLEEKWQAMLEDEGAGALFARLSRMSRAWAEGLDDKNNGRRLIRALCLVEQGVLSPPESWLRRKAVKKASCVVGLQMASELLCERIEFRVHEMYRMGLVDEVSALLDKGRELSKTSAQAIGYAEVIDLLAGRSDMAGSIERTIVRTRQLAKRQRTWFRHQIRVNWVEVTRDSSEDEIVSSVIRIWEEHRSACGEEANDE